MKRICCSLVLLVFGLRFAAATEEHLLVVHQPLAITPSIEVSPVTFVTWYGALEESTVAAVTWPALLESPHAERAVLDMNVASRIGMVVFLQQDREKAWEVTIDLTQLKPIDEAYRKAHLGEKTGRDDILERVIEATKRNLLHVGVFDCRLKVLGKDAHEDLQELKLPVLLNAIDEVWGPWSFQRLPKNYLDGNLHRLAAKSLTSESTLTTIFLIAAGETWTDDTRPEMAQLLRQLLGRVGDERFARQLHDVEPEVQRHVRALLGDEAQRELFPKTLGRVPSKAE